MTSQAKQPCSSEKTGPLKSVSKTKVFVACGLDERPHKRNERSAKKYGEELRDILQVRGFEVTTGSAGMRNGRLEDSVLEKIKSADWVVVIFCPRAQLAKGKHSTSPWVLEEKGAAIALEKDIQILIHEDVNDDEIGGLHGSDYLIVFSRDDAVNKFCEVAKIISQHKITIYNE